MFNKKFEVRIRLHGDGIRGYYCIEYSYHRFIPSWNTIFTWLDGIETWNPVLLPYEKAKEFAQQMKTIEDVEAYTEAEAMRSVPHFKRMLKEQAQIEEKCPARIEYILKAS